jgi:hypothetical protein
MDNINDSRNKPKFIELYYKQKITPFILKMLIKNNIKK